MRGDHSICREGKLYSEFHILIELKQRTSQLRNDFFSNFQKIYGLNIKEVGPFSIEFLRISTTKILPNKIPKFE